MAASAQRAERLKATKGATEEKLTIAGKKVSYISTPDGAVRSRPATGRFGFRKPKTPAAADAAGSPDA